MSKPPAAHEVLREARNRSGLKQTELAEQIGTSQSQISQFEGGRTDALSTEKIVRLAEALGVDPDEVLGPSIPYRRDAKVFFCPNPNCLAGKLRRLGNRNVVHPSFQTGPTTAESMWCVACTDALEVTCGGQGCGKPAVANATCCPFCGRVYVTMDKDFVTLPEDDDRIVAMRRRQEEYQNEMQTPVRHFD